VLWTILSFAIGLVSALFSGPLLAAPLPLPPLLPPSLRRVLRLGIPGADIVGWSGEMWGHELHSCTRVVSGWFDQAPRNEKKMFLHTMMARKQMICRCYRTINNPATVSTMVHEKQLTTGWRSETGSCSRELRTLYFSCCPTQSKGYVMAASLCASFFSSSCSKPPNFYRKYPH
jgi:hypothetical protein